MEKTLITLAMWLPLAGFVLNGLLSLRSKPANQSLVSGIGIAGVLAPFAIFAYLTFNLDILHLTEEMKEFVLFSWMSTGTFSIDFGYRLDGLTIFMAWIVTGIGFLIHVYSIGYMYAEKKDFSRFFAYLNLFIFAMLHLVMGNNLVILFLGWEGVGLASYLLIGFDVHKDSAADAGKKAFIANRIGDAGFLIGMFLLYQLTGTLQYSGILEFFSVHSVAADLLNVIAVFLFIGAVGKSAQIPLYVWLPDAMAGPTPVSALIHAATMVTAGVFMIARLSPVFLGAPEASTMIAYIGASTALFSALIALTQTDIKKVLAYSTVSQLGYMFMAMGVGAYGAGMFHLMTHAFFKALLFLSSGAVIIALHHEQDMRRMGGLFKHLKLIAVLFWIGAIAISGVPGLSGFFSKDMILEQAYTFKNGGPVLFGMGLLTALLTSFYVFRLIFLTFHTRHDGVADMEHHHDDHHGHGDHHGVLPVSWNMKAPLVVLALLSIGGGYVGLPHLFTHETPAIVSYFDKVLEYSEGKSPSEASHAWKNHPTESEEQVLMGVSILVAVIGFLIAFLMYQKGNARPLPDGAARPFYQAWSYNKFYVDELYEFLILRPMKKLAEFAYKIVDVKIIDNTLDAIAAALVAIGNFFRSFQSGVIGDYALYIFLGMSFLGMILIGGVI